MISPSSDDRQRLDRIVAVLVRLGDDVTLDDFRTTNMAAALRTNQRIRAIAFYGCLLFLGLTLLALYPQVISGPPRGPEQEIGPSPFLGLAMGGLGAVTSLFVLVLRLAPEEPFKIADEFDAIGRIVLGCVFSVILTRALGQSNKLSSNPVIALAPFLFGYSTELALRVLNRAVQTLGGFFGGDAPHTASTPRRSPRRGFRKGRY
jgi:hypothetical protein